MFRMRFMPCDFHPILLILGEKQDLQQLSDFLLRFSENGIAADFKDLGIYSEDTAVRLVEEGGPEAGRLGLWKAADGNGKFVWTLSRDHAEVFAEDVADVAQGKARAGSTDLECEVLNEIRVKVSLGEFEDEFLIGDAW